MHMKLNQKGYMLVEIVIASVLAMTIAFYLLNLTYKFKNQDEDIYQSITYMSDKSLITKNIMNDLDKLIVIDFVVSADGKNIDFTVQSRESSSKEYRRLRIIQEADKRMTVEYGKIGKSTNTYVRNDSSYYRKTLEKSLIIGSPTFSKSSQASAKSLTLIIPISSLYSNEEYDIKLFVQTAF